ncbi:hypothetical protein MKX01_042406 [Papaver californicum]|nr:hypothetical protein MKX01_042406 [Papaver californicum]
MSLSELASKLPVIQPVNEDRLYRIMRYLVHMELFNKDATTQKYSSAPPAKYLLRGWEKSMVDSILCINDKDFLAPWHHLGDGLTGNCDAFEKALEKSIWVYMSENPLHSLSIGFELDARRLKAISKAFPDIKCTIYDLPHVIADSPEIPNIIKISGDMFKSVPGADAIFMKCILHDWNDEECIQILKRCKEALPKGGKVIIVDIVLDMAESTHPYAKIRLALDLDMMLYTGGKERTQEE